MASKSQAILSSITPSEIRVLKQAVFSANSKGSYSPFNTIELDINGDKVWHSFRKESATVVCRIRTFSGGGSLYSPASIIQLEDKPTKALPIEWDGGA